MTRRHAEETAPLKPNWFHILLTLADGPRHGYAIMKEVADRTHGKLRLWPATLYGTIKRMEEEGLVRPVGHRRVVGGEDDDERRRYFGITPTGRRLLVAETKRLEELLRVAYGKKVVRRAEAAR